MFAQKRNLLQMKIVKLSRLKSASNPDWPPGPQLPPSLAASKKIHLFKSSLGTVLQPTPLFKLLSNLHISPFSSCALPAGRFFATTTIPKLTPPCQRLGERPTRAEILTDGWVGGAPIGCQSSEITDNRWQLVSQSWSGSGHRPFETFSHNQYAKYSHKCQCQLSQITK